MLKLFTKLLRCKNKESEDLFVGIPNGRHRFNTYDNTMGTTSELIKYFQTNVIKGRSLEITEGGSVSEQLERIKSHGGEGTLIFLFREGDSNNLLMETSYVMVRD